MNFNRCKILPVYLALLLAACLGLFGQHASVAHGNESATSTTAMLEQAITAYRSALDESERDARIRGFVASEQLFSQVISGLEQAGRTVPPQVWIGLGNAALQADNLGVAVWAYRRCLQQDPSNRQALQNLAFARGLLPGWVRSGTDATWNDSLFFWNALATRTQIEFVAALAFVLACCLLAARILSGQRPLVLAAVICLGVWSVLLVSQLVRDRQDGAPRVVVLENDTVLRTSDSVNAEPRLNEPLPSGAELRWLSSRERWTEVEINGRSGWVRDSQIAILD